MTSPVGHSLGAYIVAGKDCHSNEGKKRSLLGLNLGLLALLLFAANAPDLDFIYGWMKQDFNGYHHGASHSIVAALIFAMGVGSIARIYHGPALRLAVMLGLAYASHIALDLLTADTTAPFGMQLYWPFSERYVSASQSLFQKINHGGMGGSLWGSLPSIFSMHNFGAMVFELMVLGPIALISFLRRRHRILSKS